MSLSLGRGEEQRKIRMYLTRFSQAMTYREYLAQGLTYIGPQNPTNELSFLENRPTCESQWQGLLYLKILVSISPPAPKFPRGAPSQSIFEVNSVGFIAQENKVV